MGKPSTPSPLLPADEFSQTRRRLVDSPDALHATTTIHTADFYGNHASWIVDTFRTSDGETVLIQRLAADRPTRLVIPPDVMAHLLRHHDRVAVLAKRRHGHTLIALRKSNASYKALLDSVALAADASLHASSRYEQVGVDAGNGWQRQEDGGVWGTDWFGRAQAGVIYIMVNDHREAIYFIRGTDAKGTLLDGRYAYTMTFPKDGLPPVDRARGGFWSLTMYDKDYFMLPDSPNGRTNIGTVNLDANELKFADDGSVTITISHEQPAGAVAQANWLPAPEGQFALIVRTYVPTQPILDGGYKLPNVQRE